MGTHGGGTRPDYQGRGVYRALVAARAAEARRRGHRFLTVDARETSRPILERIGFEPLTKVRDWTLPEVTGFLRSTAVLSSSALGALEQEFDADFRGALLACQPDGRFTQQASYACELAVRPA